MGRRRDWVRAGVIGTICLVPGAVWASTEGDAPPGLAMTHRMMMLVVQLGLILFAARLGNILFSKAHLPGVLGELAAGMLLGPYALGRFPLPSFPDGLFPLPEGGFAISPELYGLSSIAAVVLLFTVGLETDLKLLLRHSLAGGLVGAGGMIASFLLGAGSLTLLSGVLFGEPVGLFSPPALFLGTIATATSVGVSARVLSEKRKLDSPEGVTILSAAVIDDVMGVILLAVVMSVLTASGAAGGEAHGGIDWGHVLLVGAKAVGVWLVATVVGIVASRKISFLLKWFGERTSIAVMALGLALVLAGLFEEAGLAMIIGAYVMGLSLSRADISHVIRERLAPIYALLVPVFFCTTGMRIDLGSLGSPPVLIFGVAYAAFAVTAKVIGCGLPAMLANFNLRGAARIGFGMTPRCEVALIIAGVGLSAGLLPAELFSAVIVMVVVNTLVAPAALLRLFASPARGTRRPEARDRMQASVSFEFPSIETTEFFVRKLVEVFESEGFYVHRLGHGQMLHQLRKDTTVIDFHSSGTTLTFSCHQAHLHLVNTAVFEAVAALEQTMRGLKEPLDSTFIRSRLQEQAAPPAQTSDMKQYITPELIRVGLEATDKRGVIDELLGVLDEAGLIEDIETARNAVWEREQSMSTGLQYGVAIPHGKTGAVDRLVCAVGIDREGVDFGAIDGEPSKIFILTLSPVDKPAPHVQFMSTVSQVLDEDGRRRILEASTPREVYRVLTAPAARPAAARRSAAVKREPQVVPARFGIEHYLREDLLEPNLQAETPQDAIRELIARIDRAGLVRDARAATETVLAREAQMSTAMAEGIAVPHGRTDTVDTLVCAVGLKKSGLDAGATDERPTRIFVLVITPEAGADPYLQFVASVMTALDQDGRERLLAAETPEQMRQALIGNRAG